MKTTTLALLAAAAAPLATRPAHAQAFTSVITQVPGNAFGMKLQSIVSFLGPTSNVGDVEQYRMMGGTTGISLAPGATFAVHAPALAFPTFTSTGDSGSGDIGFAYTNGGPGAPDRIDISFSLHGCATTARVGPGLEPANLSVVCEMSYVLPAQANLGTYRWTLPALPDASSLPTGTTIRGGVNGLATPLHFEAGYGGTTLLLDARHTYVYSLACVLYVPYGTDPDYSTTIRGMEVAISPVPEPAESAAAAGVVLGGWLVWRRRRSR